MMVNMGSGNAIKVLQRAANLYGYHLNVDGIAGPKTFALLDKLTSSKDDFPHMIALERMTYYANLVVSSYKFAVFLKGWNIRAKEVLLESLKLSA
jgi:lysozyme family protein